MKLSKGIYHMAEVNPSKKLAGQILHRIELLKQQQLKRELWLSYLGFAVSVLVFFYTWSTFGGTLLKSDFFQMISLVFSDLTVVAKNWNDYSLSLLETFPTWSIIAVLSPLMILAVSFYLFFDFGAKGKHKYA